MDREIINELSAEELAKTCAELNEDFDTDAEVQDSLDDEAREGLAETNFKIVSPARLVARRFFRSHLSMIGLVMIIALFLFSFVGPLFSPYKENQVDRTSGKTVNLAQEITFNVGGEEYSVYDVITDTYTQNIYANPDGKHWLGTDSMGYDVLTQLMYGGRISLTIGFVVVILEMALGILIGGISGFFGKRVDMIIMRIVDIFNCLPTLPILIISASILSANQIYGARMLYWLMVILTIFGWSGTATLVRGQILSLREQEYIMAAECTGMPASKKIFKHLLPNIMPQLIVSATLGLGSIILYEATLSFLGLGASGYAAWGSMISAAQNKTVLQYYPNIWAPPGVCIVAAVLGFNFIGDGLRDAFDPKAKR